MNADLEELASLYVLDRLEACERAEFEARLLREPDLAACVRQLEDAVAARLRSLPPTPPPSHVLAQIERQLDVEATASAASPAVRRGFSWPVFAGWGLAAVIALSLATLAVQSIRRPAAPQIVFVSLGAQTSIISPVALNTKTRTADARFFQLATLAAQYWKNPELQPVRLSTAKPQAYALFDPEGRQGFIAVEQLPALAANQRYHLWIADPQTGTQDAGILPSAGNTRGLYSFALPSASDAKTGLPAFFVTIEEITTETADRPRGQVVLGNQRI